MTENLLLFPNNSLWEKSKESHEISQGQRGGCGDRGESHLGFFRPPPTKFCVKGKESQQTHKQRHLHLPCAICFSHSKHPIYFRWWQVIRKESSHGTLLFCNVERARKYGTSTLLSPPILWHFGYPAAPVSTYTYCYPLIPLFLDTFHSSALTLQLLSLLPITIFFLNG